MAGYINGVEKENCVQLIKCTQTRYSEISFWVAQQNVPDTTTLESQVRSLESQVGSLESQVRNLESRVFSLEADAKQLGGTAIFFVGAFCALWAQNTGRNAWLWFFCGIFFAPITVIVLLAKNSADRRLQR